MIGIRSYVWDIFRLRVYNLISDDVCLSDICACVAFFGSFILVMGSFIFPVSWEC